MGNLNTYMKKLISKSEIVGLIDWYGKEFEVCASADANFDDAKSRLLVELQSFLRPVDIRSREQHLEISWLPKNQSLVESAGPEEASDLAREIFDCWVKRVRQAVPCTLHPA